MKERDEGLSHASSTPMNLKSISREVDQDFGEGVILGSQASGVIRGEPMSEAATQPSHPDTWIGALEERPVSAEKCL